jgi:hypothetical protein
LNNQHLNDEQNNFDDLSEYDIATDLIDECLSQNQIVEISKGNYALVPRGAVEVFGLEKIEAL